MSSVAQVVLVVSAVCGFLGTAVLEGLRERFRGSERVACLQVLFVAIWLVSVILLAALFPGNSAPDPRF